MSTHECKILYLFNGYDKLPWKGIQNEERSGSVVECLTRD